MLRKLLLLSALAITAITLHAQSGDRGRYVDINLYHHWQENELRNNIYGKAYQRYVADSARTNRRVLHSPLAMEAEALGTTFTEAFWQEKDYDRAFHTGFRLEELLPTLSEADYPYKREAYYKLGEAYYLMLDFHKSIQLLENALSPVPLAFNDRTNLNALNILGICHANIGQMDVSDNYFRNILLSGDTVLDRPLYNAYALAHLGCNAMLTGQYDKALAISNVAWPVLRKETNDWGHLAGMCYCRGRSLLEKGEYRQASVWIDSLVHFAHRDQYNQTKRIKQAHLLRADYFTALGDARQAKTYRDSLVGVYKQEEENYTSGYITRASQRYNDEKIADRDARLQTIHIRLAAISIMTLLSFAAIGIILSLYHKKNAAYKTLALKASQWAQEDDSIFNAIPASTLKEATMEQASVFANEEVVEETPDDTREGDMADMAAGASGITKNAGKMDATEEDRRIMMLLEQEMTKQHAYREPNLSADLLADIIGVHRNTLSRAINSTTGQNLNYYVNSYRIKEAVRIIMESNNGRLYIGEISEQVGFSNRSTFYRTFKQFTGITPTDFQKNKLQ